jgi:hypothetical protein
MKPDTVIRNSPSWVELFQRLIPMKTKDKGDEFERVCLTSAPMEQISGIAYLPPEPYP